MIRLFLISWDCDEIFFHVSQTNSQIRFTLSGRGYSHVFTLYLKKLQLPKKLQFLKTAELQRHRKFIFDIKALPRLKKVLSCLRPIERWRCRSPRRGRLAVFKTSFTYSVDCLLLKCCHICWGATFSHSIWCYSSLPFSARGRIDPDPFPRCLRCLFLIQQANVIPSCAVKL